MVNRVWIWLALAATVLMAASSAAGVFLPSTYSHETNTWATQGIGQDMASLFVVFPAMLLALHFANRGSLRATLVMLGLLIYMAYSYTLYAFFVHFGPWFPAYVATLGLSAYALFGSILHIDLKVTSRLLANNAKNRLVSILLLVLAAIFALQWLSEIVPALLSGTAPKGVAEINAPVNPVHVLDLAFILPGMIVAALSVLKRSPLGLLMAAPLLIFSAMMGVAILAMFCAGHTMRGESISGVAIAVIGMVVLSSVYGSYIYLRQIGLPGTAVLA